MSLDHRLRDLTERLSTISVNDSLDGFTDLHSLSAAFSNDVWAAVVLERLCSTVSSLFFKGRGARKIKDTKEICSPISLLENGASAQEALSTAEAFGDGDDG